MHLVESFSLNTGLKIGEPYIYETYFPLPFEEKYITIQPFGKFESRKYDYWEETLETLVPVLKKNNIKIVQLGVPDEKALHGCLDLRGKTDYNQAAYLIKNSLLHLGIDSFGIHLASGYKKKIVGLYCNMLPNNSGPYWSQKEDTIILEPERKEGERPSYAPMEMPKTINKIAPEEITRSVCKLLGVEFNFPYKTIFIGSEFENRRVEVVPLTHVENFVQLGVDSMIVRMDHYFNEDTLMNQLARCKCSVVTDKPVNIGILNKFKDRINEFVYFIDKDTDPDYFKLIKPTGVPFFLMTYLNGEDLNEIKLKYVDIAPIMQKKNIGDLEDIMERLYGTELTDINISNLYYKTSCYSVIRDELYCSNVLDDDNPPVKKVRYVEPRKVINDPDFWNEVDSYLLLQKTS
jgi:hypothetical protein